MNIENSNTKKLNYVALMLHWKRNGTFVAQFQVRADKDFLDCEITEYFGARYVTKNHLAKSIRKYYDAVLAEIRKAYPKKNIVRLLKTVD